MYKFIATAWFLLSWIPLLLTPLAYVLIEVSTRIPNVLFLSFLFLLLFIPGYFGKKMYLKSPSLGAKLFILSPILIMVGLLVIDAIFDSIGIKPFGLDLICFGVCS